MAFSAQTGLPLFQIFQQGQIPDSHLVQLSDRDAVLRCVCEILFARTEADGRDACRHEMSTVGGEVPDARLDFAFERAPWDLLVTYLPFPDEPVARR